MGIGELKQLGLMMLDVWAISQEVQQVASLFRAIARGMIHLTARCGHMLQHLPPTCGTSLEPRFGWKMM